MTNNIKENITYLSQDGNNAVKIIKRIIKTKNY